MEKQDEADRPPKPLDDTITQLLTSIESFDWASRDSRADAKAGVAWSEILFLAKLVRLQNRQCNTQPSYRFEQWLAARDECLCLWQKIASRMIWSMCLQTGKSWLIERLYEFDRSKR